MDASLLFVFASSLLVIYLIKWFVLKGKLPPGPIGLPIFGYIFFLSRKPYLDFQRLAKKYGNVFSVRFGSKQVVVLNDFESTKKVFAQDAFGGRPEEFPFNWNKETLETKAFTGLPWKEHRRFSLHMLRDLGLGKSRLEGHIQEEIGELLDHLEHKVGNPYKIQELLNPSMTNIISSLIFGRRLKYDDPLRLMTNRALKETAASSEMTGFLMFFPWIKKTMKFLGIGQQGKLDRIQQDLKDYIAMEFEEHEKTFNPNNIRDYTDGYLLESMKRKEDPLFCKAVLEDIAVIFFAAGSETVRLSVEWLLLTAAVHQDGQKRIQEEIDENIGRNQFISWSDRTTMPYTEAFVNELTRWRSILPLNLLRTALTDGELDGYVIPKGTVFLSNLWAIHHDPEYWGPDAEEFRPERFLTEDGQTVRKLERFTPFSTGKRACPGEPLAKVEVFMYFTSILQKFHVRLPDGNVADFEGILGGGLMPKPQDIIYTKRN